MKAIAYIVAFVLLLAPGVAGAAGRVHVVAFNIGQPSEFWDLFRISIRAAAEDLDIELELMEANGDHLLMVEQALEIAKRTENKPDYALVNNEKGVAPRMIEALTAAGIRVLGFVNVAMGADLDRLGHPREKHPTYLGTIRPDYEAMGHDLAEALSDAARRDFAHPVDVLAISGVRKTIGASERDRGLLRLARERPDFVVQQLVHSNWKREKARAQLTGLLRRWPKTRVIWAANDPMALGGMDAARGFGLTPGVDVFIGGVNWSPPVVELVRDGTMVATAGGHFLFGAWALVLLRDFHDGIDFAAESTELVRPTGLVTRANAEDYLRAFGTNDWARIDFARFSRSRNPILTGYDFSLARLLEQVACGTPPCSAAVPVPSAPRR